MHHLLEQKPHKSSAMLKPITVGRASSPPRGFNQKDYQQRIDAIAGTRNGRPNMKLAWAPQELRWCPHRMEEEARGYIFPIFCSGANDAGELVAPERWVLLERIEPQQFAPTWELGRYSQFDGSWWDWKGPCPDEKYIELRALCYHDGLCCPCIGEECNCGVQYEHCWGKYVEPGERTMEWIRKVVWQSTHDPDVDPTKDIREFESTEAQRQLKNAMLSEQEVDKIEHESFSLDMLDHWQRKPASTHWHSFGATTLDTHDYTTQEGDAC